MASGGTLGEVPEFGHFVFFLPTKNPPWVCHSFNTNIQKKIFLTKLKGHPNLFVTGEFLYSQCRNKEENTEGTEDLLLYRRIFVKSVFVRTIFDCIHFLNSPALHVT